MLPPFYTEKYVKKQKKLRGVDAQRRLTNAVAAVARTPRQPDLTKGSSALLM
ncbi:hypothetical protein [Janthinobacterium rivuli]|uniref:hypothetical protein n=1 Tax=Janthinobacterium sp. FT68W TaxID=2654255 RepID=UPI00186AC51F|nr:hypothetical protein [Janthinobacterium sp. FT68W]